MRPLHAHQVHQLFPQRMGGGPRKLTAGAAQASVTAPGGTWHSTGTETATLPHRGLARLGQFKGEQDAPSPQVIPWGAHTGQFLRAFHPCSLKSKKPIAPHLCPPWLFFSKALHGLDVIRFPGTSCSGGISGPVRTGRSVYSPPPKPQQRGHRGRSVDREKWQRGQSTGP